MKIIQTLAFVALFVFPVLGCGGTMPTTEEEDQSAVLGHLQSRDRKVTFYVGPAGDGPRFTVRSRDGQVLAAGLTDNELKAHDPALYRMFQSTMARNNVHARSLDASLNLPIEPGSLR